MWPFSSRLRPPPAPRRLRGELRAPLEAQVVGQVPVAGQSPAAPRRRTSAPSRFEAAARMRCSFSSSRASSSSPRAVVSQATSSPAGRGARRASRGRARRRSPPRADRRSAHRPSSPCRGTVFRRSSILAKAIGPRADRDRADAVARSAARRVQSGTKEDSDAAGIGRAGGVRAACRRASWWNGRSRASSAPTATSTPSSRCAPTRRWRRPTRSTRASPAAPASARSPACRCSPRRSTTSPACRRRFASLIYADAPPAARDCLHIARLRAAGAIVVGKTNIPEFCFEGFTDNRVFGDDPQPLVAASGPPAGPAAAPAPPWPPAWRPSPPPATAAARSASRPRSAVSPA